MKGHSFTYYIASYSLVGILAGILALIVLLACWIGIEVWRAEMKARRERDAELEAHRVAHHNLLRHLNRK